MKLFNFGVAKEPNNYELDTEDEIWVLDNGKLVKMEDDNNEHD